MNSTQLVALLASGVLLTLLAYVGLCLLKSAESLEIAEDEKLWQHLLHPGKP